MSDDPLLNRRVLLASLGGAAALAGLGAAGFGAARADERAPLAPADTAYGLSVRGSDVRRIAPGGVVLARAALPEAATGLTLVAGAGRAVASVTGSNRLWSLGMGRLGGVREARIDHAPEIVAARPGHPHVAVAGIGDGALTLLDARDLSVLASVAGLPAPHDLRFDADGGRLHVSMLDVPEVVTFDADTLRPLHALTLPFPRGVDHMSATIDGRWGVAASPGEPRAVLVSLSGVPEAAAVIDCGSPPARAYTGPRGDLVWLPSTERAELVRLDLAGGRTQTISLPGTVRALLFEPFADTLLALTDEATVRVDRAGRIVDEGPGGAVAGTAIESAVGTALLGADDSLAWQAAHRPLAPTPLPGDPLYRVTGLNAFSYCH